MINKAKGNVVHEQLWWLATAVRDRCFSDAVTAYEDARSDGLCHEGAWACAVDVMRGIYLESVIDKVVANS